MNLQDKDIQNEADRQLRERYVEPVLNNPKVREERSKMLTVIVGIFGPQGARGENICPYIFHCEKDQPDMCKDNYRNCHHYQLRLTHDFLDGRIILEEVEA